VRAAGIEEARQASTAATDFVPAADLFRELHDALPDDAICVDEIVAQMPQMIHFLYERKRFAQFRGWAGAAREPRHRTGRKARTTAADRCHDRRRRRLALQRRAGRPWVRPGIRRCY
jgi:hypothetical protein